MARCEDEKKAEEVRGVSERISAVSAELIGCADRVAEEGEETSPQQLEDLQETLESTELLRRDWASQVSNQMTHSTLHLLLYSPRTLSPHTPDNLQVHLITAHIDALTAKVSAPLDRLVDLSLQASRTSGMAKQHLLGKFEKRATFISNQLEEVSNTVSLVYTQETV